MLIGGAISIEAPGSIDAPGTCVAQINDSPDSMERVRVDEETFRSIFAQHQIFIFRFLYGMVGQRDLAEDLTQETFLRAYRSLDTHRGESTLSTWLCGAISTSAASTVQLS